MLGFRRDESGAVAVTVAILVIVFVGLSALVVDMGFWYNVRRQLQAGADAAALAGCQALAQDKSNAEVWSAVEEYAAYNNVVPVDGITPIAPSPGGLSDIGDDYVKVTLETDSRSFFGRAFGMDSNQIQAQAVAEVGYLAGAQNPLPWALPILRVTRMVAEVEGYGEVELSKDTDGTWTGFLPFGASPRTVDVIAYNDQTIDPSYPDGVPELVENVANLIPLPATSRFAEVRMMTNTVTAGAGESVRVYVDTRDPLAADESIVAHVGKKDVTFAAIGPTSFSALFTVEDGDDLWQLRTADIAIAKAKKDVEVLPGPLYVSVRRATHPIKDVQVRPVTAPAGAGAQARITVTLNEYTYGNVYELKVIGGSGETGNFMAIDFSTLRHTPNWQHPQDPAEYPELPSSTSSYYDYIAGSSPAEFLVHIGDTVWTEPGNMSGPATRKALDERFGGEASDFAAWEAAGKPGSRRLVYLPITEKVQIVTGQTPLRVVSFATFYVESVSNAALIHGRFVEYTAPSWMVTPESPVGGLVIKTAHLTADRLDF